MWWLINIYNIGIYFTGMATSNRGEARGLWVNAALQFLVWFSFDFGRHTEWQFDKCTSKPEATDALGVRTPGLTANYSCSYNDIPRWAVIGYAPTGRWPYVYTVYVMRLLIALAFDWDARSSAAKQFTYNHYLPLLLAWCLHADGWPIVFLNSNLKYRITFCWSYE